MYTGKTEKWNGTEHSFRRIKLNSPALLYHSDVILKENVTIGIRTVGITSKASFNMLIIKKLKKFPHSLVLYSNLARKE